MDKFLEFLQEFNIQNIISLIIIVWYFTRDLKKEIEKVNAELHQMNTRISRIEGTVYGKEIYEKIKE